MSYTKTNWQSGDVITAEKLNNIERGIEDASGGGSNNIIYVVFNEYGFQVGSNYTGAELLNMVTDPNIALEAVYKDIDTQYKAIMMAQGYSDFGAKTGCAFFFAVRPSGGTLSPFTFYEYQVATDDTHLNFIRELRPASAS